MERTESHQIKGEHMMLTVGNINVCYNDAGEGNLPLIFIHGFPFDNTMWVSQIDELQKYYRVISYDVRGYGKSTAGDENFSINLFADDLLNMMDILQIQKTVVCGLSMGGYIALNAVNRFVNRFGGLILCDTTCEADSESAKEKRFKNIQIIDDGGKDSFVNNMLPILFSEQSKTNQPHKVEKIKGTMMDADPISIIKTLKALAERWETCSTLNEIRIPTLIICGTEDKITPPEKAKFMHQQIKGSRMELIGGSGHLSPFENPEEVNGHIRKFLSEIE